MHAYKVRANVLPESVFRGPFEGMCGSGARARGQSTTDSHMPTQRKEKNTYTRTHLQFDSST